MKRTMTINFKNGKQITVEPKEMDFGLLSLENELYFNVFNGKIYKRKDNVLCGEDITDTVDTIVLVLQYK